MVLVLALVFLGPARLPDAARSLGKAVQEFRRMSAGLQAEVRDAFDEPQPAAPQPVIDGQTAPAPSLPPLDGGTTPPAAPADGPTPADLDPTAAAPPADTPPA